VDLKAYLEERRSLVNRALEGYLPPGRGPARRVLEAMRYSLFAGGKRLRPILCLAACETRPPRFWRGTACSPRPSVFWPTPRPCTKAGKPCCWK